MMHLGKATHQAKRLASSRFEAMDVVHCGGGYYVTKRHELSRNGLINKKAVRRTVKPAGSVIENHNFDRYAV